MYELDIWYDDAKVQIFGFILGTRNEYRTKNGNFDDLHLYSLEKTLEMIENSISTKKILYVSGIFLVSQN